MQTVFTTDRGREKGTMEELISDGIACIVAVCFLTSA